MNLSASFFGNLKRHQQEIEHDFNSNYFESDQKLDCLHMKVMKHVRSIADFVVEFLE